MGLAVSWINGRDFWVECLAGGVLGYWWVGCFSGGGRYFFYFLALMRLRSTWFWQWCDGWVSGAGKHYDCFFFFGLVWVSGFGGGWSLWVWVAVYA